MKKPRVEITYCSECHWLPRSSWMAQELLHTFSDDLAEVALIPSELGGTFQISIDKKVVWERKRDGGFPDAKLLKQRVRDVLDPGRNLGHLDH